MKPLYYSIGDDELLFASEQKALFQAGLPRNFDSSTFEELLCFRYTAGERTPFRGVSRLLPGHLAQWHSGHLRVTRWWDLAERIHQCRTSLPDNPLTWFRETFDSAVRYRLISDVPVGVS